MTEGDIILRTDRLLLRQASSTDIEALHTIASDYEVIRHTGTWPWPADRAFTASKCQPIPSRIGIGGHVLFENKVVGMISADDGGSLGYMFARTAWGKGFATEMGRAFIPVVFRAFDWPQLRACVFSDNPASSHVLQKLGFDEGAPCMGHCEARGGEFPIKTYTLERPQSYAE